MRSAPARSGMMLGFSSRHAFQAATPCLSIATCSSFAHAIGRPGPLGSVRNRGTARPRAFSIFAIFVFRVSFAHRFSKAREMRRIDLVAKTLEGWSRLNPAQREQFFQAGLKAAVRLDRPEFRALASAAAQEHAARRSGRSGLLCNFGCRHGLAAEIIGRRAASASPVACASGSLSRHDAVEPQRP